MDKDRAIITQVCAKIAADLTDKQLTVEERIGEFAIIFSSITDIMIEEIYGEDNKVIEQNKNVVAMVKDAFKAEEITVEKSATSTSDGVVVKGKQHGPLPDWLIKACKRDGVTTVYDNRDSLALNPKRPSFKAVDAEKAYWPPRSR
jgi:predicted rRNA methylase YqxC with S4 and FtsJ domains